MAITLPAFKRYPHIVKFKTTAGPLAGIVAAMTSSGTGIILYLPATGASGAIGASGANVPTPLNTYSLFDFITIDTTLVDDFIGTLHYNDTTGATLT